MCVCVLCITFLLLFAVCVCLSVTNNDVQKNGLKRLSHFGLPTVPLHHRLLSFKQSSSSLGGPNVTQYRSGVEGGGGKGGGEMWALVTWP